MLSRLLSSQLHANPVITSMAGFESSPLLLPLEGGFSGLKLRFSAASSVSDPVVTPLAGFAGSVITCMAVLAVLVGTIPPAATP